ncbi:MAG: 4Fe-4S binding protein [Deltaproteobacteria bacterium]|nr:4Fe-4S binding protein [Deltaproteobacteria bacterium]
MNPVIFFGIICLGFSSIVIQMTTLREFLVVFSGNEIVLGLVLGNWLLLTGVGSFLGRQGPWRKRPLVWLCLCQVMTAILPPLQICLLRVYKSQLMPGLAPGIHEAFWSSLILLSPYCLISGLLLTLFSKIASPKNDAAQIGATYSLDTLGGIIGGIICSLVFIPQLHPVETTAVILVLNLFAAMMLLMSRNFKVDRARVHFSHDGGTQPRQSQVSNLWHRGKKFFAAVVVLILVGTGLFYSSYDLEKMTARLMYPGLPLVEQRQTPYGVLSIFKQAHQVSVFENGAPAGSTDDPVTAEETAHYALSQHAAPKDILLISGGLVGVLEEIAKHRVQTIDYVEMDPQVMALVKELRPQGLPAGVHTIAEDAIRFVKKTAHRYDVVIMRLPGPVSVQMNRFYTLEFFKRIHEILKPDGVFSFGLAGSENYTEESVSLLNASVFLSLKEAFKNILIIPGAENFYVASDHHLSDRIAERLTAKKIETRYVNSGYLLGKLTPERFERVKRDVAVLAPINKDLRPISFYFHLQKWLSQSENNFMTPVIVMMVMLVLAGFVLARTRQPFVYTALFASGFSGSGLEVVLLIALQVVYGCVYQQMGIMFALFLAGCALGSIWGNGKNKNHQGRMLKTDFMLAVFALLLGPVLSGLQGLVLHPSLDFFLPFCFPLFNGVLGFMIGAQFSLAAHLVFGGVEDTAGRLYAFDLAGACLGALTVSVVLIPILGMTGTCCLIGGLKIVTFFLLSRQGEAPPLTDAVRTRRSALASFAGLVLIFATTGAAIGVERTSGDVYALSFHPISQWGLLCLLALGLMHASGFRLFMITGNQTRPWRQAMAGWISRASDAVFERTRITPLRWVYYLGLALIAFFPVLRCYFKIPYLFCHVCPRKCAFGFFRPYLVPAILLMNLENKMFCHKVCPFGTMYHCQTLSGGSAGKPWRVINVIPYAVLIFTLAAYFMIEKDFGSAGFTANDWYNYFFNNAFDVSLTVIGIAVVLILLGYRFRRSFCRLMCPLGICSDLILKCEKHFLKSRKQQAMTQKGDHA